MPKSYFRALKTSFYLQIFYSITITVWVNLIPVVLYPPLISPVSQHPAPSSVLLGLSAVYPTIRFSFSKLSERFNIVAIRVGYVACFGLGLVPR